MLTSKIMGAGGAGGAEVSFISSSTHSNYNGTMRMPTCEVGDLIVVQQYAINDGGSPSGYGTGFTAIDFASNSYYSGGGYIYRAVRSSYRIAQAGDSGASKSGFMNGNNGESAMISIYRPSKTIISVNALDLEKQSTSATPSPKTINCSNSAYPTVSFATTNCISSFSPTPDTNVAGFRILGQKPTATDVSVSFFDAGRNLVLTHYLELVM